MNNLSCYNEIIMDKNQTSIHIVSYMIHREEEEEETNST